MELGGIQLGTVWEILWRWWPCQCFFILTIVTDSLILQHLSLDRRRKQVFAQLHFMRWVTPSLHSLHISFWFLSSTIRYFEKQFNQNVTMFHASPPLPPQWIAFSQSPITSFLCLWVAKHKRNAIARAIRSFPFVVSSNDARHMDILVMPNNGDDLEPSNGGNMSRRWKVRESSDIISSLPPFLNLMLTPSLPRRPTLTPCTFLALI